MTRTDDLIASERAPLFDSDEHGTGEAIWLGACRSLPTLELPPAAGGTLLVVSPHPDDEVLGVGGLMRSLVERGWSVEIVSVTDGEAAFPDSPDLAAVRASELADALAVLGVPAKVTRLHLPDGDVASRRSALEAALVVHVAAAAWVLTTWSGDGHPDHEAVGAATVTACRTVQRPDPWMFPIWAWHWSDPTAAWFARARTVELVPEVHAAKTAAVVAFASQCDGLRGPPVLRPWVVDRFVRPFETVLEPR